MNAHLRRLLGLLAVLAVVVSLVLPATVIAASGNGNGGNGGSGGSGGETTIGNNLSYPAIWADGAPLTLRGSQDAPSLVNSCGLTPAGDDIYCQQNTDNTWQAGNVAATGTVDVTSIDWGDNLEARAWAAGSQVRVETTLYETLTASMTGYNMYVVSGARSTEMQGTDGSTFDSTQATVYSRAARLTIQQITPGGTLVWSPLTKEWIGIGVGSPLYNMAVFQAGDGPGQYTGEINVGGKVVYGYNWKTPAVAGVYRVTFSLDGSGYTAKTGAALNTHITSATTILPGEADAKGGVAQVDGVDNLSYIDVTLTPPPGGTGGGGETTVGNNLSYPTIWADGSPLVLRGTELEPFLNGAYTTVGTTNWYHQQDANNTWQAENTAATGPVDVSQIDWGDNLEARQWAAGQQVRVETTLYKTLTTPMQAYNMLVLSGSGTSEMQGTDGNTFDSDQAIVYSRAARLTIQQITPDGTLTWDPSTGQWTGSVIGDPLFNQAVYEAGDGPGQYTGEINVGGKVVYGYNWKTPSTPGVYRITFSIDGTYPGGTPNAQITGNTTILASSETDASGGVPKIDGADDLSYIDVTLTNPNGGGGGTVTHDAQVVSVNAPASVTRGNSGTVSAVVKNNGTATDTFTVTMTESPDGDTATQTVTLDAGASTTVNFNWATDASTTVGQHTFTVAANVTGDTTPDNTKTTSPSTEVDIAAPTAMSVAGISLTTRPSFLLYTLSGVVTIKIGSTPVSGATVAASWTNPNGSKTAATATTNTAGQATFSRTVYALSPSTYTLTVTNVSKSGVQYDPTANTVNSQSITVPTPSGGTTHDAQVVSVSAPASVDRGNPVTINAAVKNNGNVGDTFSVALSESPDGYAASQSVTLAAGASTTVPFTWTTNGATSTGSHTLTVTATVAGDANAGNNSASATTQVQVPVTPVHDAQVVSVVPSSPTVVQGGSATINATVKNNGNVTDTISVKLQETPGNSSETKSVTLAAGGSAVVSFNWPTTGSTATGDHTFTVTASVAGDSNSSNDSGQVKMQVQAGAQVTTMSVTGIQLSKSGTFLVYQITGVVTVKSGNAAVDGATVTAKWTYPNTAQYTVTGTTNAAGQVTFTRTVYTFVRASYSLSVTNVAKTGLTYAAGDNVITTQAITVP